MTPAPCCSVSALRRTGRCGVRGLLAVEHDGDLPSLGGDLEGVPFAAGLGHRVHLDEIDDAAGAVGRVLALVEDVDLVAGPVGDLGGSCSAGRCRCWRRRLPRTRRRAGSPCSCLADQMRGALARRLVGDDRAVLEPPVGLADPVPFARCLAVEQRDPARAGLAGASGRRWIAAKAMTPSPMATAHVRVAKRCKLTSRFRTRSDYSLFPGCLEARL